MQHAMSYIIWQSSVALFIRTHYKSCSAFIAISCLPAFKMVKQILLMLKKKKRPKETLETLLVFTHSTG